MIERTVGQRFELVAPLSKDESLWYAKDTESSVNVTIKFIPLSPKKISRWIRLESELQMLKNLAIPNMIQIIEWGDCEGGKYVAYEHVDGIKLSQAKLSIQKTINILKQIAQTLKTLEQNDFILKDFRIDKIFMLPGSEPVIKIIEFGSISSDQTKLRRIKPNEVLQELAWMPPEVLRYEQRSIKSNLYSMGLIGHFMITGKEPFYDPTPSSLVWQIQNASPPPVSYYNSNVPASLDTLIRRLLRKDPNSRYESIDEVLEVLDKSTYELESAISQGSKTDFIVNNGVVIGRRNELEKIRDIVSNGTDTAQVTIISGEKGLGKTRMIQEVASISRSMDYPVFSVTCENKYKDQPYYIVSQIIYDAVNEFGIGIIGKSEHKKTIASICPELVDRLIIDPMAIEDGLNLHENLPKALASVFAYCLEQEERLIITIDDADECDSESQELLLGTVSEFCDKPIKIFLACAKESSEKLFENNSIFAPKIKQEAIELRYYTKEETLELIENSAGSDFLTQKLLDKIFDFAKGNPYDILQIIAVIISKKDSSSKKPLDDFNLPQTQSELAKWRIDCLDERTRTILSQASIFGDSFDEKLLLAVSPQDDIEVEEALDYSVSQMLIHLYKVPSGYKYKFANDSIKALLLSQLSHKQRIIVHDSAVKALKAKQKMSKFELLELIEHLSKSSNSHEAIPYLIEESKKAQNSFEPKQAMHFAKMAYEIAIKTADSSLETETATRLIQLLLITGKFEKARETIEGILSALRKVGLDNHSEAQLLILYASLLTETSKFNESEEVIQQAYKIIGRSANDEILAKLHAVESKNLIPVNRKDALLHTSKAFEHSQKIGDKELTCSIHLVMAIIHAKNGRIQDALMAIEKHIEISKKHALQFEYASALVLLSQLQMIQGEFDNANSSLTSAKEIAFKMNSTLLEADVLLADAQLKLAKHNMDTIRRLYERSIELCMEAGRTLKLCEMLVEMGLIYIEDDDSDGARYYHARCKDYEKQLEGIIPAKSNILLAHILFLENKLDKAEQIAETVLKNQHSHDIKDCLSMIILLSRVHKKQEDYKKSITTLKNISKIYTELAACPYYSCDINLQISSVYLTILEIGYSLPKNKRTAFFGKFGHTQDITHEAKHHLDLAFVASLISDHKIQSLQVALKWAKYCKLMSVYETEHANYHLSELARYVSISNSLIAEIKPIIKTTRYEEELSTYG